MIGNERDTGRYTEAITQLEIADQIGHWASRATEVAAIAAAITAGYGDKKASDQKAVEAMRTYLNRLPITGRVVVGEGEKDEAPMLFIGEIVGSDNLPNRVFQLPLSFPDYPRLRLDIAVDPLEGTNATADLKERASSVLVMTEFGGIFPLDHTIQYMDKLMVGPEAKGKVNIDAPVEENVAAIAKSLDRKISDVAIVVLKRDRNAELIKRIRSFGARVMAVEYGDLMPGVLTAARGSNIDAVMGIGGAPEGVLSAAALKVLGGEVQARAWAEKGEKMQRLLDAGVDFEKVYTHEDLVPGKMIVFSATAVTNNERVLEGVRFFGGGARTNTLLIASVNGTVHISLIDPTLGVDNIAGFPYRLS